MFKRFVLPTKKVSQSHGYLGGVGAGFRFRGRGGVDRAPENFFLGGFGKRA